MSQYKVPENWDKWPTIDIAMSGVKRKAKYDAEEGTVYMLDDNGEWNGRRAKAPKSMNGEKPAADGAGGEAAANGAAEQPAKKKKPKKSKTNYILIAIIVVLVAMLLFQNKGGNVGQTFNVIIAMENINPGESIRDKLASVTISADEYRNYAAAGGIYTVDQYNNIINYIATSFIPKDGFVTYTNVGETFYMTNPWTLNTNGYTPVTIPITDSNVDIEKYMCGNVVTLTVQTTRLVKEANEDSSDLLITPNMNADSKLCTYRVDTYVLENVIIADILNGSKRSLYGTYATLAAIPSMYLEECMAARYETGAQIRADTPAYITVLIKEKDAAPWWQKLEQTNCTRTVSVKVTGANCETELQDRTYKAIEDLVEVISQTWEDMNYGKT